MMCIFMQLATLKFETTLQKSIRMGITIFKFSFGAVYRRINSWKSYEPVHEISHNVVCATSKASDQPAHTRSLISAFASRLSIL